METIPHQSSVIALYLNTKIEQINSEIPTQSEI